MEASTGGACWHESGAPQWAGGNRHQQGVNVAPARGQMLVKLGFSGKINKGHPNTLTF